MLPDSTASNMPLERLTRLYDGLEQLEDMWDEDLSDSGDSYGSHDEPEQVWAMNERGEWEVEVDDGDDWSTDEESAMVVDAEGWLSTDPTAMQLTEDIPVAETKVPPVEVATPELPAARPEPEGVLNGPAPLEDGDRPAVSASEEDKEKYWKRFEILSSVPIDHAFYTSTPAQPSRSFLARLSKEYRVLSSSLPGTLVSTGRHLPALTHVLADSVLVRTYEDRNDLLRCLIIGPENTPYEDAPFVIDWMLDSNFPQSPPIAHFHSWTNGNGRGMSTTCVHVSRLDSYALLS